MTVSRLAAGPSPVQPFPKFYVFRPDQRIVPLIAIDELPSWLQVGDWDWSDVSLFEKMIPASFNPLPRDGEYDVVCYNCYSNVDALHRSVSERSDRPPSAGPMIKDVKSCPGAFYPLSPEHWTAVPPMMGTNYVPLSSFSSLRQSPFYTTHWQTPFVGMCLVDTRSAEVTVNQINQTNPPSFLPLLPLSPPLSSTRTRSTDVSMPDQKPVLNPEAAVFSPSATPEALPEPVVQPGTNIVDSPAASVSDPPVVNAEKDAGPSQPLQNDDSTPRRNLNAAIAQLRQALGVHDCKDETPEPHDVKMHDVRHEVQPKKKVHFAVPDTQQRRKRARRGGRRARTRWAYRKGAFNVDRQAGQQNSATKRRDRRDKMAGKAKKDASPGNRYWHMMRISNWRAQVPQVPVQPAQ